MPIVIIDPDEHETIRQELTGRFEARSGETSVITGDHEDLGRVTLKRENGVFRVEADEVSFVRPRGVPPTE